jgi:hypothetical protein
MEAEFQLKVIGENHASYCDIVGGIPVNYIKEDDRRLRTVKIDGETRHELIQKLLINCLATFLQSRAELDELPELAKQFKL